MLTTSSLPITSSSRHLLAQVTAWSWQCLLGHLGLAASTRALRLPNAARPYLSQTRFDSLAAGASQHIAPSTRRLPCPPRPSLFVGGTACVQFHSNVRGVAAGSFVLVFDFFLGFVSSTLEPRTQLALRYSMVQPILRSDRPGHIYALELAGRCCGNGLRSLVCVPTVSAQTLPGPTSFESRSGGP